MNESSAARAVSVSASETGDARLPADAAATVGPDATMTVGPGEVVTFRPARKGEGARRTMAEIIAMTGAQPVTDTSVIRPKSVTLTPEERAALRAFLAEE
jgi:hypothetical protein